MKKSQAKGRIRRKNYFIDKRFQTKFILKFCALIIVGGLLTIGILYFLAMRSTTVAFVDSRVMVKTTADFILPILIQTVAVVMVFISIGAIIITLFVSHKIAGPLYHFKAAMKVLEGGDFSSDFKLRRLDQLWDLAQVFDKMIIQTRTELKALKNSYASLKGKLDGISEEELVEGKRALLKELKNNSSELNRIIEHFKI